MNLLDTASLVVTPNGYKASKLYSIIPSDGTGDMTFARSGDTATRVNSSGLIETVLANKPRLDYLGSTCPKLLLEPQRTNLATYSEQFDTGPWGTLSTATVTANVIASPSGSVNADKLVENTINDSHLIYGLSISSTANTNYTVSLYLKAGERFQGYVRINNITNEYDSFNLNTGICTYGTLTSVGNGWFRYVRTYSNSTTISSFIAVYMKNSAGSSAYTGDGTSGMYLWGLQWEQGAYATSYIPTTTASVTRNAEDCSKTGISSLIGVTEGTILIDYNIQNTVNTFFYLGILGTSPSDMSIYYNSNNLRIQSYLSGTLNVNLTIASLFTVSRYKIAVAYKENDLVVYVNGIQVGSDTSCSFNLTGGLKIGYPDYYNSKFNSTALWKTRLQNSELATLTSL